MIQCGSACRYFVKLIISVVVIFLSFSCSSDLIDHDDPANVKKGVGFITFRISSGSSNSSVGTRADIGFQDGEDDEFELTSEYGRHFAMFYQKDVDYAPTTLAVLSELPVIPGDPSKTITRSLVAAFPYNMEEFPSIDMLASYLGTMECYIVLNTSLASSDFEKMKKSDLMKTELANWAITVDGKDYFTMSNSVYLNGTTVATASNLDASKIYSKESDAITAAQNGEATITAYLERVAAKFTINGIALSGNNIVRGGDYSTVSVYTGLNTTTYDYITQQREWDAEFLGYGINGLEKTGRLFKSIANKTYYTGWNAANYFRSYWGEDPHYTIDGTTYQGYPHQYRRALETDTVRSYHGNFGYGASGFPNSFNTDNEDRFLNYVSFDAIKDRSKETVYYAHENTYDDSGNNGKGYLGNRGFFSAGTHLLVAARLNITGVQAGADLYRDQNEIFFTSKEQLLDAKLRILNNKILPGGNTDLNILNADWLNHQRIADDLKPISWPVGAVLRVGSTSGNARDATWEDLDLIPAELSGGDGQVLIAPADASARYWLGDAEISYNDLISLFHKVMGAIDHYKEGYMYYPVAILHNAATQGLRASVTVGDTGSVRNHWYQFNINSISAPGRPVSLTEQPIIPMLDVKRDYINVTINIADWHQITQNDVPLSPV